MAITPFTKEIEMKQTVNLYDFRNAFRTIRPDNFSYAGLEVLFDFLEECENDTGEEYDLDVIALCCDFSEIDAKEAAELLQIELPQDEDDQISFIEDELCAEGILIGVTSCGTFVIRS